MEIIGPRQQRYHQTLIICYSNLRRWQVLLLSKDLLTVCSKVRISPECPPTVSDQRTLPVFCQAFPLGSSQPSILRP